MHLFYFFLINVSSLSPLGLCCKTQLQNKFSSATSTGNIRLRVSGAGDGSDKRFSFFNCAKNSWLMVCLLDRRNDHFLKAAIGCVFGEL